MTEPAPATTKRAPAFLPIHDARIPVPHGVQPWLPTWVDHGREILFQNQVNGLAPSDLEVAELDRPATRPQRVVSSAVGAWAPAAATYQGPLAADRHVVVRGPRGGTATLTCTGNLAGGGMSVTFDHWTADGRTFVTGPMSAGNPNETSDPWTIRDDVTVSGAHTSRLRADLQIDNNHHPLPLPRMTRSFSAVYDGHTAPPLARLGACQTAMPRATPLQATARVRGTRVTVTVHADIAGDRRPVVRALVHGGTQRASTNAAGRATLTLTAGRRHTLVVSAGSTFTPVRLHVR